MTASSSLLADAILLLHFAFVLFVVGALPTIWVGAALGRHWVRNFWFRAAHLAAILFVAAQALLGQICPLTLWEDELRGGPAAETGFIARWTHRVLYWSFPEWVFTSAYLLFALVVIATYVWVRPDGPGRR